MCRRNNNQALIKKWQPWGRVLTKKLKPVESGTKKGRELDLLRCKAEGTNLSALYLQQCLMYVQ